MKVSALNSSWGVTTLANVQDLLGVGDKVSSIESQIKDAYIFKAQTIAASIETTLNSGNLVVTNWIDNNQELLSGLQGQSISSIMIQVFVMISVVLGIASVLAIIVMQKSKQIGILKAMGLKDGDASLVFLYEGLILGILGALL
ncbi:MAG: ABC transporter permease, partial [Firmicutes bacterium]|nr:ABC transporter permease [Bacillota bacterium]